MKKASENEKTVFPKIKTVSRSKDNDENILSGKLQGILRKKENVRYRSWVNHLTKEMKRVSVELR